ncbi:MAG: guanylate kinase [Gammaproteobacteria bacterium]|nr:guanylate kinase [Gammaproteobacteria bacterium]
MSKLSSKGELIIVSAPSGAGKTSLVDALISENDRLCVSVSHTTRPKRPNEMDGINYHFVEKARFLSMLDDGDFLESAEVYGHYYGTSKRWVNRQLDKGLSVILEIDWQGAAQVKALFPQSCYIFIVPPSLESLSDRLRKRAQDDDAIIAMRMEEARAVLQHATDAEFLVVNEDFGTALDEMGAIIKVRGLSVEAQQFRLGALLASLTEG